MKKSLAIIVVSLYAMCTHVIAQTDSEKSVGSEIPGLELRTLGDVALAHGFYQEACNYYRIYYDNVNFFEALRIEAKLLLIKALTLKGDYTLAQEEIHSLKKNESIPSYVWEMAELRIAISTGNKQNTLTLLNALSRQVEQLKGEDFVTYLLMWIMYYETQGNWEMALLNANKLESYAQEHNMLQLERRARYQRIYFLTKMGSTTLAEAQNSMLKPENESELCESELLRSLIYLTNNNLQGALQKYESASKLSAFKTNQLVPVIARDLATSLIAQRRYKEAEPFLKDLYNSRENETLQREALRRIIDLHVLANEQNQAIAAIEHYLSLYPEATDVTQRKMQLLNLLTSLGDHEKTLSTFKKFYADKGFKQDERVDLLRIYARYLQSQNQNIVSIEILKEIIGLTKIPSIIAEAQFQMGERYFALKNYAKASECFKKSSDSSSDWRNQAIYMQMVAAIEQKEYEAAMKYNQQLEQYVANGNIFTDALYFKAFLNEQLGKNKEAQILYQQFVDSYPSHKRAVDARLALGEIQISEGALDSARNHFESLIKNYPNAEQVARAKYQLIYAYSLSGADTKAILIANDLLENYPQTQYALEGLNWLADYKISRQEYQQALVTIEKLLSMKNLAPEDRAQAMYDQAKIYMELGQYKEAIKLITSTENINCGTPLRQNMYILYADILCKQKNFLLATMTYQLAYNLDANSIYGIIALGRMGDSLFSLYSADEEVNERYLKEARICYLRVLNTPKLSPEIAEQTYWKIGHAFHLQREFDAAMGYFMRPLLLRLSSSNEKQNPNNMWLNKCAHSALSILRNNINQEKGTKAIKICDMMVEFDHKNSVYWQRLKGEVQSEFKGDMLPIRLTDSYPITAPLVKPNIDTLRIDSSLLLKPQEIK